MLSVQGTIAGILLTLSTVSAFQCSDVGLLDEYAKDNHGNDYRYQVGLQVYGIFCWATPNWMNRDDVYSKARLDPKEGGLWQSFKNIYVAQASLNDKVDSIFVKDTQNEFKCAAIQHKKSMDCIDMNRDVFPISQQATKQDGLHFTISFYNRDDNDDCTKGFDPAIDGHSSVALFIDTEDLDIEYHKDDDSDYVKCIITPDDADKINNLKKGESYTVPSDNKCVIYKPRWNLYKDSSTGAQYLQFLGSLNSMAEEFDSTNTVRVEIRLERNAVLYLPLNTRYSQTEVNGTECQQLVDILNKPDVKDDDIDKFTGNCQLSKIIDGPHATNNDNIEWIISGHGQIDGYFFLHEDYDWSYAVAPDDWYSLFYRRALNSVDNCQICLYSNPTDPSKWPIQIVGPSVVKSGRLGMSTVQLNYQDSIPSVKNRGDINIYKPVRVQGFKRFTFLDKSDGPELTGTGTKIYNSYFMQSDDGLKLAASDMDVQEITIIQGDGGGVMNLGSYGLFLDTLRDIYVSNVYIHRIIQDASDDGKNAILATRTCNQGTRAGATWGHDITNIVIENVFLQSFGAYNNYPINALYSLFQIETYGKVNTDRASYCNQNAQFDQSRMFTINQIYLNNWFIDVDPAQKSWVGAAFQPDGPTHYGQSSINLHNVYVYPTNSDDNKYEIHFPDQVDIIKDGVVSFDPNWFTSTYS